MRHIYQFVLFFATIHAGLLEEDCSICNGYICADAKAQCGPNGYLIGFGLKFCTVYTDPYFLAAFTKQGTDTVFCIRDCLLELTDAYINNSTSFPYSTQECEKLDTVQRQQFHPKCYHSCGFCTLQPGDVSEAFFNRVAGMFCHE